MTTVSNESWIAHFTGQSTPWRSELVSLASDTGLRKALGELCQEADALLAPVAPILLGIRGPLNLLGKQEDIPLTAAASVPGILLAQYGAYLDVLPTLGQPQAAIGHSQGVLCVAALQGNPAQIMALAHLIGAAATQVTAAAGIRPHAQATPMMVVRASKADTMELPQGISRAIRNTSTNVALAGRPETLAAFSSQLTELDPTAVSEFLEVTAPFHSEILEPAVACVKKWANALELAISMDEVESLARGVLTDQLDWAQDTLRSVPDKAKVVNLGPGNTLARVAAENLAGSGVTYIDAGTAAARDDLLAGYPRETRMQDWSIYTPGLREIQGKNYVDTAFTRLTGRSAILVGGMTPTTVDAPIVAAAANAGHWVEMAGGGQVTEEILNGHMAELSAALEPGRTAQFNAMFLDRYQWDLQFAGRKAVVRQRNAGAPLDGVVISAGIPDKEEALELISQLRREGFPYIAFKPGTISQIRQIVAIAKDAAKNDTNSDIPIIAMIEDGQAGGHHSWESLPDLLLATYEELREAGVIICAGGGLGDPERAASFIDGTWARVYGRRPMPVDGVFLGTTLMAAKEAATSPAVKELLVQTEGITEGWVRRGEIRGGMTSGLSQLHADLYEVANASAYASRLLAEIGGEKEKIEERRDEIIEAINKTAKPYFGDVESMTYEDMLSRYVELAFPWVDASIGMRFLELIQRVEARLSPVDHGEIPTIFSDEDLKDPRAAIKTLTQTYPEATRELVSPADAIFFVELSGKYPKPVPFVPVIDSQIVRRWGADTLWQSHDARYSADEVRVIPGPISVSSIHAVDEPVADILARYEKAAVARIENEAIPAFSHDALTEEEYLHSAHFVLWHGMLVSNPLRIEGTQLLNGPQGWEVLVPFDSMWDGVNEAAYRVRELRIPLTLAPGSGTGAYPIVDETRLTEAMNGLLQGIAGVGSTTAGGTAVNGLVRQGENFVFSFGKEAALAHALVCEGNGASAVPSALFGSCWPAVYGAIGEATHHGSPVVEGLLSTVHLDHCEQMFVEIGQTQGTLLARSHCTDIVDTPAGRVIGVHTTVCTEAGERVAEFDDRFALRGRNGNRALTDPPARAGIGDAIDTPRSFLGESSVKAPSTMAAFAEVSGDYNPIHTSTRAAALAGLDAPIVHGMWLCAAAQYATENIAGPIKGWTYRMFDMVPLGAVVDIRVERVGRLISGGLALEVTCSIDGNLVASATAAVKAPLTAYLYPGQGVQSQGMALDDRHESPAAREIWEKADRHTREKLGFSILAVVRDNPRELVAKGHRYYHPEGLLNLTQFTQVALATVAAAQTARLREDGVIIEGSFFAGHSLGEYTALSAYGRVFSLESVLEIVFKRGSAMHELVPRDEQGRSNYRMAALRPNQIGITDVVGYVNSVAEATGEFLEVVNLNLEGQQYSIAGTVAGLQALEKDAAARAEANGGKRALIMIPGLDVPFHSRVLRGGVDDFRELLEILIPERIETAHLVGRYIPNLVARPFEVTEDFAQSIIDVAPSAIVAELLEDFDAALAKDRNRVVRLLIIELLAWQFASPVRWIETQQVLIDSGVQQWIEVGLASAPTLANLGARTVAAQGASVTVLNSSRDAARVRYENVVAAPDTKEETPLSEEVDSDKSAPVREDSHVPVLSLNSGAHAGNVLTASEAPDDLPFTPADALDALLALHNKLRPEQIAAADTVETLTNGVSSKRNQVLMDLTNEFGLSSMDGAAEAPLTKLRQAVIEGAHSYKPFGPFLTESVSGRLRQIAGSAGAKPQRLNEYLASTWAMGQGWATHVSVALVMGTREGRSTRGGELATITISKNFEEMVDEAVAHVASAHGINVAKVSSSTGTGAMIDSAALEEVTGKLSQALAHTARTLLSELGYSQDTNEINEDDSLSLREAISAELGQGWEKFVSPIFDANKVVSLCDRWATAREDVARIAAGETVEGNFEAVGDEVARQARWHAIRRPEFSERLNRIAQEATTDKPGKFSGKVAVVTGAAPHSIAAAITEGLLAEGATVVVTTSRLNPARLTWAAHLYRKAARGDAQLWIVPANLGAFRDIDAFAQWLGSEQKVTVGAATKLIKPAFTPDLFFPFAAPPVSGTAADAGAAAENQARVLLWGVERLMGKLAYLNADTNVDHRMHTILPGSPNRGTFGGDGAYGEVKAAFDAIVNKWSNEPWGERVSIAHARIGWVRGTGLMGGNDPLVDAVEAEGVRTWSTTEMAAELLKLCSAQALDEAAHAPLSVDLTGGLHKVNLRELTAKFSRVDRDAEEAAQGETIRALPSLISSRGHEAPLEAFSSGDASPEDIVVVVGVAEVGPWGSSRTRLAAELGIQRSGEVELTAAGVLELAWMMGLLTWHDTPKAGWYNADGVLVPEEEIFERYRDEVVSRCGVRAFVDDGPLADLGTIDIAPVHLESDVTFTVADEASALRHVEADPDTTSAALVDGEWTVTRKAGALTYVPRRTTISRTVGGQFPTDFDPAKWGIPAAMIESVDRMAIWNMLATVDAFVASGFTPGELLSVVHPSEVASTQGTGFGGMSSMRRFYIDRFMGEERPQDLLQETLGNVIAAHTMQSYVGGYGAMVHPVGACATAAVSVEEGVDKILCGKASFVVAGGIDDISLESVTGFGDMSATADSSAMAAKGIQERFYSRAGDVRRGGFIESQGGGTVLLARGDIALEMGLPVLAVVGYAQSFADGAHTSIPAPGIGALAAGRGRENSRLAKNLAKLGVEADDISVISKHDTSTQANDPNEAELHVLLAQALGRSEGNPLYVISQKTLTGHAKGGAALFQLAGLTQVLASGLIPGNVALDCQDPVFKKDPFLVWPRTPIQLEGVKAALLTSLGFGHVSALVALVGRGAFEAAVKRSRGIEALNAWREASQERLKAGEIRREKAMMGRAKLYEPLVDRRFAGDAHAAEIEMLLHPDARLGADGYYPRTFM